MVEKPEKGTLNFKVTLVGIVVNDIDKTATFFQKLGIGPFMITNSEEADGKTKVGLCLQENFIIELFQPLEGDTIHAKFLREKGQGIEKIGNVFSQNFEQDLHMMKDLGLQLLSRGQAMGGQFATFDARAESGLILEIAGAL